MVHVDFNSVSVIFSAQLVHVLSFYFLLIDGLFDVCSGVGKAQKCWQVKGGDSVSHNLLSEYIIFPRQFK
jgi:hypothetical protein